MCTQGREAEPLTLPGGELLLGCPTLLTMHRVNAELERTRNKPKRFKQLNFNAMAAHEQTLFVLPVKKKTRVNFGYK